jgi:outer membrane protein OmpA-like peptidoglycan-associated protein
VLKTASYPELERVLKFLSNDRIKRIRISGHTDSKGPDAYNEDLSRRRAKSVYQYLIDNGISEDRLEYEGYGEKQPIDTNDTAEGRANNRRVEFTILELGQ